MSGASAQSCCCVRGASGGGGGRGARAEAKNDCDAPFEVPPARYESINFCYIVVVVVVVVVVAVVGVCAALFVACLRYKLGAGR